MYTDKAQQYFRWARAAHGIWELLCWSACIVLGIRYGAHVGVILLILFEGRAILANVRGICQARATPSLLQRTMPPRA